MENGGWTVDSGGWRMKDEGWKMQDTGYRGAGRWMQARDVVGTVPAPAPASAWP